VVVGRHGHPLLEKQQVTLADLADYDWIVGTPRATRRAHFNQLFEGHRRPEARIETCSLPTVRLLLSQSNRLTLMTSHELLHEEDALTAVPFGPIKPVPCFGLTMRENWLPTQLQANFIELIQNRVVGALMPATGLPRATAAPRPKLSPLQT
jgi:DNA-binding transcriptional LysR family regulator